MRQHVGVTVAGIVGGTAAVGMGGADMDELIPTTRQLTAILVGVGNTHLTGRVECGPAGIRIIRTIDTAHQNCGLLAPYVFGTMRVATLGLLACIECRP